MSVPVNLEIFMTDLTRAGLASVSKNVGDAEGQARQLIAALEQVRAEYQRALEANRRAGQSYQQELANVQALTGQINGLKEGLKELEAAKQQANATPVIDTDAVARRTSNLRMQFQQVARELPSLAMGPQMFILAVSNNLPMLADAIADVRKQNELLKASGQKSVPVWKQLGGALLSWQTALVAGISLLIVYGDEIIGWVKNLFKAKGSLSEMEAAMQRMNDSAGQAYASIHQEIGKLDELKGKLDRATRGTSEWKAVKDKIVADYSKYLPSLEEEIDKTGTLAGSYNRLAESIRAAAAAKGYSDLKASEDKKYGDMLVSTFQDVRGKLADIYGDEDGSRFFEGWKNWLKRLEAGEKIPAEVQEAYSNISIGFNQTANSLLFQLDNQRKAREEALEKFREIFDLDDEDIFADGTDPDATDTDQTTSARKDYASELSAARLRAQQKVEELRIRLMKDGVEKRRAIARQEYEDNLAEIAREEQQAKAVMDAARKQGDLVTDDEYAEVSQRADRQRVLQRIALADELYAIDQEYRDKNLQAEIEYNKRYGAYAEQRAAILAEGARKAAAAETSAEKKLILRQTQDKVRDMDLEHFKSGINLAEVFGQLDTRTTEALRVLRDKLKEYIDGAAKELGPEDLKELQDAFKKLDFKIGERDPFGELRQGMAEYKSAQKDVDRAQEELNTALRGGEVATGLYEDANGKLARRLLSVEQAEENLATAQNRRQQALGKLTASANSIGRQGMQVVEAGRELLGMMENFGVEIPERVGALLDGIGQTMSALESIDLTKPFTLLTAPVKLLSGIGNIFAGIFGGGDDSYEEMKRQYETLIQIWDELIEKKKEYIDINYGAEAQKVAEETERMLNENLERYRELARGIINRQIFGSTRFDKAYNETLGKDFFKRASELAGQQIGSIRDVIQLDPEVLGKLFQDEFLAGRLQEMAGNDDFSQELTDYLRKMAEIGEQLEEVSQMQQEAVTGIGFDAFKESYVDMLADLTSTNEDFADNLEKNLQNAILRSLIADKYADAIRGLYDSWVSSGADGLTPEEAEALRKQQQDIVDQMLADREALMEDFGWTAESAGSSQSPQGGALTTMSQDSISAFEGIGRSLQTHVVSLDKVTQELRDQGRADSESLMQIVNNTSYLLPIYELMERMDRDGIKIQ